MEFSTVVIAILLALVGTAALFLLGHIRHSSSRRRLWRRFSELQCGVCQRPFGLQAIEAAEDISPWEELWDDPDGGPVSIGCQPTCLSVVCPHCQRTWELRYNSQGEWFGPEFTVEEPETLDPEGWSVAPDIENPDDLRPVQEKNGGTT